MKNVIRTNNEQMAVTINVVANEDCTICIDAYDFDNPKTYFLTREKKMKGSFTFEIMLPISPKTLVVSVYNKANGNQALGIDKSFSVDPLKIRRKRLPTKLNRVNWGKYNLRPFIDLATGLSYNLNYMEPGLYKSSDGTYLIELLPTITDGQGGQELNTPARINKGSGKIQVSKKAFDTYTVPQRMAILFHEVSHFYVNQNPDDESEADLNGLTMYLALGFQRIEAYDAFIGVFMGAPTEANKKRYDIIDKFIKDWEKTHVTLN